MSTNGVIQTSAFATALVAGVKAYQNAPGIEGAILAAATIGPCLVAMAGEVPGWIRSLKSWKRAVSASINE